MTSKTKTTKKEVSLEEEDENNTPSASRSIRYIFPNLITILAICAGLSAIRLGFEHRFYQAVLMILIAAFCDATDGRVARVIKGDSPFGAQMDSLADIVNFGVAPSLLLYSYILKEVRSFGWIAILIYSIACCLRLARFNVMLDNKKIPAWKKDYFVGVPAPAGALLVLLPIYIQCFGILPDKHYAFLFSIYTVIIAFLLVSRLPVWNGKRIQYLGRDFVLPLLLFIVAYVGFMATYMWYTLAVTAFGYLLFLPISFFLYRRAFKANSHKHARKKVEVVKSVEG